MFGLDARIALAIFGALSVISGAALYNAIQNTKTVALLTELKEIEKAIEQYYLDTGSVLPLEPSSNGSLKISELVSSTNKNWNGPYINYDVRSNTSLLKGTDAIAIRLGYKSSTDIIRDICTDIKEYDCYAWVEWYDLPQNLKNNLDIMVDVTQDTLNGVVKSCNSCGAKGSMLYMINIK